VREDFHRARRACYLRLAERESSCKRKRGLRGENVGVWRSMLGCLT
jgi:hypothetical protein